MNTITIARFGAIVLATCLLALQITGGLEYTEGGSFYTRASMIAAMVTLATLPIFIESALSVKARGITAALAVAFVAFLAYSLPATVGRTAEIKEAKAVGLADVARTKDDLERTTVTLNGTRSDMISECRSGEGKRCRAQRNTVKALEDRQERLRHELAASEVTHTGDMGSDLWAWALSWAGVTGTEVRKVSVMAFAVGLDVAIWSLVWFFMATGRRTVTGTVTAPETVTDEPEASGGSGGRGLKLVSGQTIEDRELKALRKALTGSQPLTNDELADLMRTSKAESSRRVTKAEQLGMVTRKRVGRHVAISLHAH